MKHTKHISITLLFLIGGCAVTPSAETKSPAAPPVVANAGFEDGDADQSPEGWQLGSPPARGNESGTDIEVAHLGAVSLKIDQQTPDQATWISNPVELEVGHLYRLRGFIKTYLAFSDPTSRYPTAVPACLTMESFPFTNHSPAVGATRDWTEVEVLFIATKKQDRVRLHLGYNGTATGSAWFDDISVEKVHRVNEFIPAESVRWYGPAYRYDDKGWIMVHIEGAPYERGYQYGHLLQEEIVSYAMKLAHRQNLTDPQAGWEDIRLMTQAWMLPGFDEEYQIEMKGIADGAAGAGAKLFEHPVDLVDIASLNSVIDLGQISRAMRSTPNATSEINFLDTEDELKIKYEDHKCSAFAATGSATSDNRFVFGQIFMWGGYTGVHWNVITDLNPEKGHRFVYHTFPGGIHSGADFYISQSGLVVGETTVRQTPFDPNGTPQSNRIRKAIQYADNVEEMVEIMTTENNGQYANEWPFANFKDDEVGIFLLGTKKHRLWRSKEGEFPGDLTDFYWCNNNNKDLEVRKEYVVNTDNAPYDLTFRPWNRDLAFNQFYHRQKGNIDAIAGVDLWASSPINRAHACDGKITTGEMAEQLVFLAHYGKTTLREKVPGGRLLRDKPGAIPHLSLGYITPSPLFITEQLQHARSDENKAPKDEVAEEPPTLELKNVEDLYQFDKRSLWQGTVYPASNQENWLVSGSAAYWRILEGLDEFDDDAAKATEYMDAKLAGLNERYLYDTNNEGTLRPKDAETRYDRYVDYQVPRIKGTILLHQLRLLLGNEKFAGAMAKIHTQFHRREATTEKIVKAMEEAAGLSLDSFVDQWLGRDGLPDPQIELQSRRAKEGWNLDITVTQKGEAYHLLGTVDIEAGDARHRHRFEINGESTTFTIDLPSKPSRVVFNAGRDFPVAHQRYNTVSNFLDDFHNAVIIYGTGSQIEANHTMALRWQRTLADSYVEILVPVRKDAEVTMEELTKKDLIIIGSAADNSLIKELNASLPFVALEDNYFCINDQCHTRPDEGVMLAAKSPYNPQKTVYMLISNSALQLYKMTGTWQWRIPGWAVFKDQEIESKGYHQIPRFEWRESAGGGALVSEATEDAKIRSR